MWTIFISAKQEVREKGGSEEFGEVNKKSWVSSAKQWMLNLQKPRGRRWMMKRRGPRTEPCGTPEATQPGLCGERNIKCVTDILKTKMTWLSLAILFLRNSKKLNHQYAMENKSDCCLILQPGDHTDRMSSLHHIIDDGWLFPHRLCQLWNQMLLIRSRSRAPGLLSLK